MFLHVLADTLGSVGVILSSLLVQMFGWNIVDPICSIFIALLIVASVVPLLRESGEILILATPNYKYLHDNLNKVSFTHTHTHSVYMFPLTQLPLLDGVVSWSDAHFWQQGCGVIAGTLHVQVAPSANDQKIITMVTNFLRDNGGVSSLTVQVEKERFLTMATSISYVRNAFPSTPPDVYVNYGPQTGEIKAV